MIAPAESVSDFVERCLCQLAREIHRHLPRESDVGGPPLARHVREPNVEVLGHAPLDLFDGDGVPRFFLQNIFQKMLDHFVRQLLSAE